ncbi:TrkA family potassium uptake protein [Halobacterium sp. KA-4]|jgi:trk system potassium uptake protein TrkA|uniref:potassium channel family protein n=1 Tax=Halobacterium sp. KA-4 TaxID=2896367 RepID=UPI001E42424A|nr:TrkA family potassium uptake protein [Halobacterium sp. KA-4]MCD2199814.1 TrkA family potassium uptake protein [Halobacterium sp. KA-4]
MSSSRRIVVVGGGRVGVQTAADLHERGHTVILVEGDEARAAAVTDENVATVVNGDATQPSVLEQADLEEAHAVAAVTSDPGTNLAVCLVAQRLAADLFTLARIDDEAQTEYTEYVDAAVLPQQPTANRVVDLLVGGGIRTFSGADGGFSVLELGVAEDATVAGHTLDEVGLPEGCRVVGSSTHGRLASPDLEFQPGDRYLVAADTGTVDELRALFRE